MWKTRFVFFRECYLFKPSRKTESNIFTRANFLHPLTPTSVFQRRAKKRGRGAHKQAKVAGQRFATNATKAFTLTGFRVATLSYLCFVDVVSRARFPLSSLSSLSSLLLLFFFSSLLFSFLLFFLLLAAPPPRMKINSQLTKK